MQFAEILAGSSDLNYLRTWNKFWGIKTNGGKNSTQTIEIERIRRKEDEDGEVKSPHSLEVPKDTVCCH